MNDKQQPDESEATDSQENDPADEGLIDPRDLVESDGSVPAVIQPEPPRDESTNQESDV
jgi:hypothetical protein